MHGWVSVCLLAPSLGPSRPAYSYRDSSFWAIKAELGLQKLQQDLETGEWERRYAELLSLDAYDAGYRLIIAD